MSELQRQVQQAIDKLVESGPSGVGDTASGITWAVTKNRIGNDFGTATRLGQLITGAG
jgi:hypothetical protein